MLQSHLHYPVFSRDISLHMSMKTNFPQFPLFKNLFCLRKTSVHSNLTIFKAGKFLFHSETPVWLTLSSVATFSFQPAFQPTPPVCLTSLLSLIFIQGRQHKIMHCSSLPLSIMACDAYPLVFSALACASCRAPSTAETMCVEGSDSHRPCQWAGAADIWGKHLPANV